jgi:hypothetical protein
VISHPLLPRFDPLQRISVAKSHLSPADSTRRLRCVPRVSHPPDALLPLRPSELISSQNAHGVSPSRPYSFLGAVHSLECHAPQALANGASTMPAASLQGLARQRKPGRQVWVLARFADPVPPWAFPLRGILPLMAGSVSLTRHTLAQIPNLVINQIQSTSGIPPNTQPTIRRHDLHAVLHLVGFLDH